MAISVLADCTIWSTCWLASFNSSTVAPGVFANVSFNWVAKLSIELIALGLVTTSGLIPLIAVSPLVKASSTSWFVSPLLILISAISNCSLTFWIAASFSCAVAVVFALISFSLVVATWLIETIADGFLVNVTSNWFTFSIACSFAAVNLATLIAWLIDASACVLIASKSLSASLTSSLVPSISASISLTLSL